VWTMAFGSDEVFDALLFHQVTLCSNTVKSYELALVVDVEGVGKEVLALPLTARYQCFPCSLPSLLVHPALARCLATRFAGSGSKWEALMSWFCPARDEKSSALRAAHVEKHLCSRDRHSPEPFSKGDSNYIHYWPIFWCLRSNKFSKGHLSFFSCKWWTWSKGRCPCSWEGGWKQVTFKVTSNPNHSVIL